MIENIFTVYDEKAHAYLPPFFQSQLGQATRIFADCCNKADHQFGVHPSDYTLFHLGTYDNFDGSFEVHSPKSLGNGVEFLQIPTAENPNANQISDEAQLSERTPSGHKSE